jgi:hypothetical protein
MDMKRIPFVVILLILFYSTGFAQDQLQNPGFEDWDQIAATPTDTIREPVDWSSLKTSDNDALSALAPVVLKRSSEAHSGAYSMQLSNVASFLVANGIATNGRIHPDLVTTQAFTYTDTLDDRWNNPFTARPDSMTGWYQYTPQGGDSLQIKINLHKGFGKQPDDDFENKWIAVAEFKSGLNTAGEWVRFSVPFEYFSDDIPEYALAVISSGNAYSAVAGSTGLFDDLEMIYNSTSVRYSPHQPDGYIAVEGRRTLWIRNMTPSDFTEIRIFDITGKQVWSGKVHSERIDIIEANMAQGIYVVRLNGPQSLYTQKVMLR